MNIEFIKKIGKDKLILLLLAGVVLVLCTVWENSEGEKEQVSTASDDNTGADIYMEKYVKEQERRLKEILSRIDGVGELYVMITVETGIGKNVLTESDISYEDTNEEDGAGGVRKIYTYSEDTRTVYVTDETGRTTPYVLSETAPRVAGVAVVAEGAGSARVKEKIINVIKALFGIEINNISVE